MDESLLTDISSENVGLDGSQLVTINDFDYSYSDVTEAYQKPDTLIQQLIYSSFRLLWGSLNIINDYRQIIFIALVARIITSLLDVSTLSSRKTLKLLVIVILGIYQIDCYIRRSCPDLPYNTIRGTIYTIALTYAAYSAVTNRFRTMLTKSGFRNHSVICTISLYFVAFVPMLYNEYRIRRDSHGQSYCYLRAIYMSMAMKVVSLTSVVDRYKSPLSLLAYIIHPASTIMGAWHPFGTENPDLKHYEEFQWFSITKRLTKQISILTLVLLISSNVSEITDYVDSVTVPQMLKCVSIIYLTALEFRFSHYFTCFLTSSFLGPANLDGNYSDKFCDIAKVEWPRSLVEVVASWNIPMHCWLKRYVFKRVMRQSNVQSAIFSTYIVSSMLHGLKFHIWSVLLTLGLFTWAEYNLRMKIAKRFSACIEAKPCRYRRNLKNGKQICIKGHTRNPDNSSAVRITNFICKILTMMHLAYLGYIFVGNTDESTFMDAIYRWSSVYFYGHLLGIVTVIISISI